MKKRGYVPDRGDLVWLDFDPQAGHEQAGRRPAFVLSPARYNGTTGLMICCPVTSRVRGYPFEVAIAGDTKIRGVVLADQVKSLDWKVRNAEQEGTASQTVLDEALAKLAAILEA